MEPKIIPGDPTIFDLNARGLTSWAAKPIVQTDVACDGQAGVWKGYVSYSLAQVVELIGQPAKLLTDGAIANADCAVLTTMWQNLQGVILVAAGTGKNLWLPQEFVQAHEDVHRQQLTTAINRRFQSLVTEVETITRPCDGFTYSQAASAMKDELRLAEKHFHDGLSADLLRSYNHLLSAPSNPSMSKFWRHGQINSSPKYGEKDAPHDSILSALDNTCGRT